MLLRALARQRGLLPFFARLQTRFFSQSLDQSHEWSQSAQQAFVANEVIKMILKPEFPQTFGDKSLRQRIVEHKYENKFFKVQNENSSKGGGVLAMFTDGIILDPILFKQQRVISAKQDHPNREQQKFIFHPNYIVTPQIFKILRDDDIHTANTNMLITGDYGIAKTISIILYFQLSNKIHKFFYQSNKDQDKKKERETLLNNSLIENNIPQIWYWSVNEGDLQLMSYEKIIMHEMPYLSVQDKEILLNQIYDMKDFNQALEKMYPKSYQIYIKLVVDQINAVASMARKWHAISALYHRKLKALGNEKNQQALKIYYEERLYQNLKDYNMPALRALQFIQDIRDFAHKKLAFSSVNIQKHLLGESDVMEDNIGLNFDGHDQVSLQTIEYQLLIRKNSWTKIQFWNYFLFQFTTLLSTDAKKQFENNKHEITQVLLKQLQQKNQQIVKTPQNSTKEGKKQSNLNIKTKAYYRLLYIRKHFQNQSLTIQSINKNPSTLSQKFASLIRSFTFSAIVQHGKRLKQFINQNKGKKSHLLSIYEKAQKQKDQKAQTFSMILHQYIRFARTVEMYDEQVLSKQILNFRINQDRRCYFGLTPSEFMQVLNPILFPKVQWYYPTDIYHDQYSKAFMGHVLQVYLKQNLDKGAIFQFQIGVAKKKQNKSNKNNVKQRMCFQEFPSKITMNIHNEYLIDFIPISKTESFNLNEIGILVCSIRRNFQQLLNKCRSSPGNYFAAIPSVQLMKSRFSSRQLTTDNCASVDFAVAVYENSSFRLYTVDCSVAKDQESCTDMDQRQNSAKELLSACMADSGTEIDVTHIILGPRLPPKGIREQIYSPRNNLKITYANWNDLTVTNKSNKLDESMLKRIIQMISKQSKKYPGTFMGGSSQENQEQSNEETHQIMPKLQLNLQIIIFQIPAKMHPTPTIKRTKQRLSKVNTLLTFFTLQDNYLIICGESVIRYCQNEDIIDNHSEHSFQMAESTSQHLR